MYKITKQKNGKASRHNYPLPGRILPGIRERIRSIKTDHCQVITHAMLQKKILLGAYILHMHYSTTQR